MKNASHMTGFESLLKERSKDRWVQYLNLTESLRNTLSNQKDHLYNDWTEHHILQVLSNADMLVPDHFKDDWSDIEILLFLSSVWLHDLGKRDHFDSKESYKQIRIRHAELSYQSVIHIYDKLGLNEKEAIIIAYIVKGQASPDLREIPEKKGMGIGEALSIRRLAALLKLAHELDMCYQGIPDIVMRLSGIPRSEKWTTHESIDGLEINSSVWDLIVYSTPKSFEALEDIKRTISWANETLDEIRDELRKLRLLYRRIDHIVDDTYLHEIENEIDAEQKKKRSLSTSKETDSAVKLCLFTESVCNTIDETDEDMVFVGMPFSEDLVDVYRFAIQPAVESNGYRAWRADEVLSSGPIFCKLCGAIHRCTLALIDISTSNPNVMFELGMASALRKKVILIKNHKHSIPTDLTGFEYISYRNAYELKDSLAKALPSKNLVKE